MAKQDVCAYFLHVHVTGLTNMYGSFYGLFNGTHTLGMKNYYIVTYGVQVHCIVQIHVHFNL